MGYRSDVKMLFKLDDGRKEELRVFESLKAYHALIVQMRATSMEMFTHPDATANQVMETQMGLVRVHAEYRELYAKTRTKLGLRAPWGFNWGRYQL